MVGRQANLRSREALLTLAGGPWVRGGSLPRAWAAFKPSRRPDNPPIRAEKPIQLTAPVAVARQLVHMEANRDDQLGKFAAASRRIPAYVRCAINRYA